MDEGIKFFVGLDVHKDTHRGGGGGSRTGAGAVDRQHRARCGKLRQAAGALR